MPQARVADFGVAVPLEAERLANPGFTVLGMTETPSSSGMAGTRLYTAPELLEGRGATVQADVYALGVVLFQLVVGDFRRSLAAGWERKIEDPLLVSDIAAAVDGSPERRPAAREAGGPFEKPGDSASRSRTAGTGRGRDGRTGPSWPVPVGAGDSPWGSRRSRSSWRPPWGLSHRVAQEASPGSGHGAAVASDRVDGPRSDAGGLGVARDRQRDHETRTRMRQVLGQPWRGIRRDFPSRSITSSSVPEPDG